MSEHVTNTQYVDLSQVRFQGKVLDVGGGGEGVISRHTGDSVIAIDRRKDELTETAAIGVKIVMDACDMAFIDNTFENITCFYTLMYMDTGHTAMFFKEAYRVLKPNGLIWIWDTEIPRMSGQDVFIVPVEARLNPAQSVSAGYGIGWSKEQSLDSLQKQIEEAGFAVEHAVACEGRLELRCRKA